MRSTDSREGKLLFLDLMDKFYTREGNRCLSEALKTEQEPHSLFDSAVILFKHVVYVFTPSPRTQTRV